MPTLWPRTGPDGVIHRVVPSPAEAICKVFHVKHATARVSRVRFPAGCPNESLGSREASATADQTGNFSPLCDLASPCVSYPQSGQSNADSSEATRATSTVTLLRASRVPKWGISTGSISACGRCRHPSRRSPRDLNSRRSSLSRAGNGGSRQTRPARAGDVDTRHDGPPETPTHVGRACRDPGMGDLDRLDQRVRAIVEPWQPSFRSAIPCGRRRLEVKSVMATGRKKVRLRVQADHVSRETRI